MSDEERLTYFTHCRAHQPIDLEAFRAALAQRRQGRDDTPGETDAR